MSTPAPLLDPPAARSTERPEEPAPPWARLAARSTSRAIGWGVGAGLVGGSVYRGFMRLVTDDPHFSWAGTLLIVGIVTLVTVLVAICARARRTWGGRWSVGAVRSVTGASFLLLTGAGAMVVAPVWLLGGLALGRTDWPRALRIALWLLAGLAAVAIGAGVFLSTPELAIVRRMAGLAVLAPIVAVHVVGFAVPTGAGARRY